MMSSTSTISALAFFWLAAVAPSAEPATTQAPAAEEPAQARVLEPSLSQLRFDRAMRRQRWWRIQYLGRNHSALPVAASTSE